MATASRRDVPFPSGALPRSPALGLDSTPGSQGRAPSTSASSASTAPRPGSNRWSPDFFGNVLVPPTEVSSISASRLGPGRGPAPPEPIKDPRPPRPRGGHRTHRQLSPLAPPAPYAGAGFEARIVHPFASKQFRQPADPGNKTDDTDLAAIHCAAVNGFALVEAAADPNP